MRRVCFFNSTDFWGGGEKLHFEYASYFQQKGVDVFIACRPKSPLEEKAKNAGIKTIPVSIGDLSFLNPFAVSKVARSLRAQQIDTVIATTSEDIKMGGIAAKKAKIANVVYLRGLAVPIKKSIINTFLFNRVITHVVANSKETERQIFKNLDPSKIHGKVEVIYHGIDTQALLRETKKYPLKNAEGCPVILGHAGRLTEQKGQLLLIEAAKILRDRGLDFCLYMAGEGELKSTLQTKINNYHLQRHVHLLGFVSEMNQFMNAIDVFLLSSAWEGFGFVLVEAMLKACPVVAFNTSSNPEIVVADKTGFLVNYPNVEAFADAVERLILDVKLREEMGQTAQKHVRSSFDKGDRIDQFIRFIKT